MDRPQARPEILGRFGVDLLQTVQFLGCLGRGIGLQPLEPGRGCLVPRTGGAQGSGKDGRVHAVQIVAGWRVRRHFVDAADGLLDRCSVQHGAIAQCHEAERIGQACLAHQLRDGQCLAKGRQCLGGQQVHATVGQFGDLRFVLSQGQFGIRRFGRDVGVSDRADIARDDDGLRIRAIAFAQIQHEPGVVPVDRHASEGRPRDPRRAGPPGRGAGDHGQAVALADIQVFAVYSLQHCQPGIAVDQRAMGDMRVGLRIRAA